jgi:hypothetical protein
MCGDEDIIFTAARLPWQQPILEESTSDTKKDDRVAKYFSSVRPGDWLGSTG